MVLILVMLEPEKLKYLAMIALFIMLVVGKIFLFILRGDFFGGFYYLDWRIDFSGD